MPVLTAEEVAELTAEHDATLVDHVDYWPATKVSDSGGGYRDRWPSKSTTYACAVLDREAAVIGDTFGEAIPNAPSHTIVLPRSAPQPTPADRYYWIERAVWLEVKPSQTPGTYGPARRIECIEIKP